MVKNLPVNAGDKRDSSLIAGSGRSTGGGNGNLIQYSCLENPMDSGPWWATVHGVVKNQTGLSVYTYTHLHIYWKKILNFNTREITLHSSSKIHTHAHIVISDLFSIYKTAPPRPGAVAGRTNPTSKEPWAVRVQEGLEELSHFEGQEGQRWGDTPRPR